MPRRRARAGAAWRIAALRLLLVVGSACAGLGLAELGVRWWRWHTLGAIPVPGYPDALTVHDPRYHHRYKPRTTVRESRPDFEAVYTTNALGLRGSRDYGPKPPGTIRLLMLGDSFTFGIGVNEGEPFCDLLQAAVAGSRPPVEIINAGVGSYSPTLEYLTLRDLYLAWDPDAVILWFDFSDLQDDELYARRLRYDPAGVLVGCDSDYADGHRDWAEMVLRRSALATYLHSKLVRSVQRIRLLGWRAYLDAKLRGEDTKLKAVFATGPPRLRMNLLQYDRYLMIRGLATEQELDRYWVRTGGFLLKIQELLEARGIPFVLGLYPQAVQVGPDHWANGREYYLFERGRTYDDPLPFTYIERFAAAHGIPVINTLPSFLAASDRPLFLPNDGHFTPEGHRALAAHALNDPVFRRLLRPRGRLSESDKP